MTSPTPPPLPTPSRGLLIVIEGLDRSGKSTQCRRLASAIATHTQRPVHQQSFPDRTTPTGTLIDAYLTRRSHMDDHSVHLLFSANRWEARAGLLASLASGTTVVVDRYSFSGAVYSAAKRNPELGVEWAWAPEVGLPMPDLVVFLDLEEHVAAQRGGFGVERYENREMQASVRALFGAVFQRLSGAVDVKVVDAGVGVDEVAARVWACFEEVVRAMCEKEARGEAVVSGKLPVLKGVS